MGEFKGTRGEWTVCEHSWGETSVIGDGRSIAFLSIEGDATEENQYELEERQLADARLMAASKDLLEAAQAILPFIPTTSAGEGGAAKYSEHVRAADKVRAAISKALGEKQ